MKFFLNHIGHRKHSPDSYRDHIAFPCPFSAVRCVFMWFKLRDRTAQPAVI